MYKIIILICTLSLLIISILDFSMLQSGINPFLMYFIFGLILISILIRSKNNLKEIWGIPALVLTYYFATVLYTFQFSINFQNRLSNFWFSDIHNWIYLYANLGFIIMELNSMILLKLDLLHRIDFLISFLFNRPMCMLKIWRLGL